VIVTIHEQAWLASAEHSEPQAKARERSFDMRSIPRNPLGTFPPQPLDTEGGCKVGWNYYQTREDADACSRWAKTEAKIKTELGYDFGWCCPGHVRWSEARQLWRVCIP
jgi:hypothetical protein